MNNSSNLQNHESQRVPDLVRDSRLPTCFLPSGATQHTIYRVSDQSPHRRPSRINETWYRQRELGSGGFGCVWLERCVSGPTDGKVRAVKEIRKDPSLPVPFSRELEAMAKFSHMKYVYCFVECYGWFESENKVFIAMEYIKHGDLQNYLNQPFSEVYAKVIAFQLVEGLGYMHENGFAHRDLKPKVRGVGDDINILVCHPGPDWWVKIGDFGISKRAEATALRTVIGTEGYVAPEVIGFVPDQSSSSSSKTFSYTFAVDMWALGEVLFRMIAQRAVFPSRDDLRKHVLNKHPFPVATLKETGASEDCCNFVTNCMAVDPKCRLKASKAAAHPWIQTSHPPSRSSGRISPERGHDVPPSIPNPPPAVNFEDTARWSKELLWASQNGRVEVVQGLLWGKADVTVRDKDGLTPLHIASQDGHVEVVQALLEKGADTAIANKEGLTPLYLASYWGYVEVVKALLEKGADTTIADKEGLTPLHIASQEGHAEVVKALLEKGADTTIANKSR
ncbi:hypothetical protein NW764_015803 [Fusarium oxysporum]|nr:hypothetical protein NW764_015803 [Fusarium oxysporum]